MPGQWGPRNMARGSCPAVFWWQVFLSLPLIAFFAQLSRRSLCALPWSSQQSRRSLYTLPSSSQLPYRFWFQCPRCLSPYFLLSFRIPECISVAQPAVTKILVCSAMVESAALSFLVAMVFLTAPRCVFFAQLSRRFLYAFPVHSSQLSKSWYALHKVNCLGLVVDSLRSPAPHSWSIALGCAVSPSLVEFARLAQQVAATLCKMQGDEGEWSPLFHFW